MPGDNNKIIGYFGYSPPANVVCDGNACLIAGSETAFKQYMKLAKHPHSDKVIIKKTSFVEVSRGLSMGAPYSFDKEAYDRFYPLAKKAGLDVAKTDFKAEADGEIKFMTLRPKSSWLSAITRGFK